MRKKHKLNPLYKAAGKIKWFEYLLNAQSNEHIHNTPRSLDTLLSSLIIFQASLSRPPADITRHTDIQLLIPPKDPRPCSQAAFLFSNVLNGITNSSPNKQLNTNSNIGRHQVVS